MSKIGRKERFRTFVGYDFYYYHGTSLNFSRHHRSLAKQRKEEHPEDCPLLHYILWRQRCLPGI